MVNALACHRCDLESNPGVGMWQGSGRPSKVGGFHGFSSFLHHVSPQNANIRAFENTSIRSLSFLFNLVTMATYSSHRLTNSKRLWVGLIFMISFEK